MQFYEKTALQSDRLDWKPYIRPKDEDLTNLEQCKAIDDFNEGVWNYNNSMLPRINELLEKMGIPKFKLDAPPKYYAHARKQYDAKIREEEYRIIAAVRYLGTRQKLAERDYKLEDGPGLADGIAEKEEIERQIKTGLIDISKAAGINHRKTCTCDNKWDGKSQKCEGHGVRLRWKRNAQHHFLQPYIEPEIY